MKIALTGYGKMGRTVERVAVERGHEVALIIDTPADWSARGDALAGCDVAIEFSTPATAEENIRRCLRAGVPVVAGTTGWYDRLDAVKAECAAVDGALFVASNFSIGMNIAFELNRRLAELTDKAGGYTAAVTETHHIHKLDAPSGTAIHLAEDIVAVRGGSWRLVDNDAAACDGEVAVKAIRRGEVPGIHEVRFDSPFDTITLTHDAKSRDGLAQGALLAAEFLKGKKGFFTMKDLLGNQR